MKACLFKISFLIAILISSLNAHQASISEDVSETINPHLKEIKLVVSLEDLFFDQEEISVSWEGHHYPISSLEREDDHWIARVNYNSRYCLKGHNLCTRCGLCHVSRCRYYVAPCWK